MTLVDHPRTAPGPGGGGSGTDRRAPPGRGRSRRPPLLAGAVGAGTDGTAPFAEHPLYALLLAAATGSAGVSAMVALSLLGTVAAAGAAAALAGDLDPAAGRPALWVVGLGGSGEWGGRYFAIGIPWSRPCSSSPAAIAVGLVAALAVCAVALSAMGVMALRSTYRFTADLVTSVDGPASGRCWPSPPTSPS